MKIAVLGTGPVGQALAGRFADLGHDVVVGVWRGDRHPDHAAVGWAAATAAAGAGSVYLEYPVWMWHWASPDDVSVPWARARVLPLPQEVVAAKRAAVSASGAKRPWLK